LLLNVAEQYVVSTARKHVSDAVAHGACSDYANSLDLHTESPTPSSKTEKCNRKAKSSGVGFCCAPDKFAATS
jgi:hypothetical protein